MEINMRIPDDYCQGSDSHVQPLEEEDWEEPEDVIILAPRGSQLRIRGRSKA